MDDPHKIIFMTNDQSNVMFLCHWHPGAQAIWISRFFVMNQGCISENLSLKELLKQGGLERLPCAVHTLFHRTWSRQRGVAMKGGSILSNPQLNDPDEFRDELSVQRHRPSPLTGLIWAQRALMHDGWGRNRSSWRTPPLAADHRH